MNLLFDGLKKISNYYPEKKGNERLEGMTDEELQVEATKIMEENGELKRKMSRYVQENNLLSNSVIGDNMSEYGRFYKGIRDVNGSIENKEDILKTIDVFKEYLYQQRLFYGGIEEDDVKFIDYISVIEDDYWEKNKSSLIFKQKLLERNYQEMFNELIYAQDIQQCMPVSNEPVIKNKQIEQDNKISPKKNSEIFLSSSQNDNEYESKKEETKLVSLMDTIMSQQKEKNEIKESKERNEEADITVKDKEPVVQKVSPSKKEVAFNFEEQLLNDDEGFSFNIKQEQKQKKPPENKQQINVNIEQKPKEKEKKNKNDLFDFDDEPVYSFSNFS